MDCRPQGTWSLSRYQRQSPRTTRPRRNKIVNRPRLLFADEPTGNLDTRTSESIMELFQELSHDVLTIVFVTHEPDVASYASGVVAMRDGRIVSDGVQCPRAASRVEISA